MAWTAPEDVGQMLFSPSGLLLATSRNSTEEDECRVLRLWEVTSGRELAHLNGVTEVYALAFASERELVIINGAGCRLWNADSGTVRVVKRKNGCLGGMMAAGSKVVSLAFGDVFEVVDLATGKVLHRMTTPRATDANYDEMAAAGSYLAALCRGYSTSDSWIALWDVERGKRLRTYEVDDWNYGPPLALHPQGSIAISTWKHIRSYGLEFEEELEGFKPFPCQEVEKLTYSADGRTLNVLTRGKKGLIRLDALSGQPIATMKIPSTLTWGTAAIDPAGEKVAVAAGNQIEVLDIID
jgi:WD40 repeat protein